MLLKKSIQLEFNMAPREVIQHPSQHQKKSRIPTTLLSCLAVLICFIISSLLIFVTVKENKLTAYGTLSSVQRTLYTTASTIIATVLTAFVVSQTITASLCHIDDRFVPALLSGQDQMTSLLTLASSWQAILSLGSIQDRYKPRNWGAVVIMVTTGLITTCITSGFTPTIATRELDYFSEIPSGDPTVFAQPYLLKDMPDAPAAYNHSSWLMRNGSIFYSWTGRGGSPAHEGMQLCHGINILDPSVYAYVDEGVAVHSSAIGTPYSVYAAYPQEDDKLVNLLEDYDWNIQNISACVPVMVHNPFKCRKGAQMDWIENYTIMRLYSEDSTCMITQKVKNINDTEMLKGWCTHGEIGQATLLLGANFNYHAWLAVAVGDENIPPYNVPPQYTYSIQCEVDARDVYDYREVILSLENSERTGHAFSRVLTSERPCTPNHASTIGNTLLATTATANHYLLYENLGNSGWFETINSLTTRSGGYGLSAENSRRSPPWAFNDSSNALEDILGLTAALVSSRICKNSTKVLTSGAATVRFTRIGPGKYFALVFAIPPLLSGLVLLSLLFRIQRYSQGYESSSLLDLVNLGKALGISSVQTVSSTV